MSRIVSLTRTYSAPNCSPMVLRLKKGKLVLFLFSFVYGRLRTIIIRIAPTMISTTMIAIAEARMYVSVFEATGAVVGAGVDAAESTTKVVSEYDGQ